MKARPGNIYDFSRVDKSTGKAQAGKPWKKRYMCPWCRGNSKNTLLHDEHGEYFYCFRCHAGGGVRGISVFRPDEMDEALKDLMEGDFEEHEEFGVSELPPHDRISPWSLSYEYLVGRRGLEPGLLDFYQIVSGRGHLSGYVIFPCFEEGVLCYWIARSYTDQGKAKLCPKGVKRDYVFNYDGLFCDSLIICEGPISALAAGLNGVAVFGKFVTPRQVDKLVELSKQVNKVYVSLDGDAKGDNEVLAELLYRRGLPVYLVDLPVGKDPASLSRAEYFKYLEQATQLGDLEAEVRRNLDGD